MAKILEGENCPGTSPSHMAHSLIFLQIQG